VRVAEPARLREVGRRVEIEAAGGLQEGLAGHGGEDRAVLAERGPQLGQRLVDRAPDRAPAVAHPLGRAHEALARQEARAATVHTLVGIAEAHHPGGVAVVAVAQRQEGVLAARPEVAPVPDGHLHGHLHADRAGVREEDVRQPGRGQRDQPLRQPLRRPVGQPAQHHVREVVELRASGGVELGVVVAVDHAPPARDGVDEHAAVGELEPGAGGPRDLVLHLEPEHLRVGVPEGLGPRGPGGGGGLPARPSFHGGKLRQQAGAVKP